MIIKKYEQVQLITSDLENEAVKRALINLRSDLHKVLDVRLASNYATDMLKMVVGTIGVNTEIEKYVTVEDLNSLRDTEGNYHKEAFLLAERNGVFVIAGTDRRGTIYGIYDFTEWLGVSPWYFCADVPVRSLRSFEIPDGYTKTDWPVVEYRGIFINDEEELQHWAERYMGEDTISEKTYAYIFELLLRLKLNYLWPAMHVNSFNMQPQSGKLADDMGIVIGTSHCDMLMRSNNREWKPWLEKKGYTGIEYDYSIPGRNREILEEYWRESVEQNKDFDVCYTLGMRGVHDNEFLIRELEHLTGEELLRAKIQLLEDVMAAQDRILSETIGHETMKTFIPYKEVLEFYDNGLQIADDLTMVWVNDNYGHVRRYPGEREKKRPGGNGIYYHNSYWANPVSGASYLFITTIPLTHTRNELKKAYNEGIQKLWVTNFGAIKPLEEELSFYAALAWETGKEDPKTDHEEQWLKDWINRTFTGNHGAELAPLLLEFDQLTNARKIELMDSDIFAQNAYGDEAAHRIHRYEAMLETAQKISDSLYPQERDAFFQMILMKIQAAYLTNCMFYYSDRSNLCMKQGKKGAAKVYAERSMEYLHTRRKMLDYYNHIMLAGKWNGIVTPEDFPPPRTSMNPAAKPPISLGEPQMVVTVRNGFDKLTFHDHTAKWIEIGNAGAGSFAYEVNIPKWLKADTSLTGNVSDEIRILFTVDETKLDGTETRIPDHCGQANAVIDRILVKNTDDGSTFEVPVIYAPWEEERAGAEEITHREDDGRIVVEAADGLINHREDDGRIVVEAVEGQVIGDGWKEIPHLGRSIGSVLEAGCNGAQVTYAFTIETSANVLLELHRFPTLNSVGHINVSVSVDGCVPFVLETEANDSLRGNWQDNVKNGVDKLYAPLRLGRAGKHTITFQAMDPYFAFTRFVLYTSEYRDNSLGHKLTDETLPKWIDLDAFARKYYTEYAISETKPWFYVPVVVDIDNEIPEEEILYPEDVAPTTPEEILKGADSIYQPDENGNIMIEAAAAVKQTANAWYRGEELDYCMAKSHQETGLCMYVRNQKLHWEKPEEAPSIHYKVQIPEKSSVQVWVLACMWDKTTSHFTLGMDGTWLREQDLFDGLEIWRYSMEHAWEWIPACTFELEAGEHEIMLSFLSSTLRIDRLWLTSDGTRPPKDI